MVSRSRSIRDHPHPSSAPDHGPLPGWAWMHRELRRPDVMLVLLWEEYRAGAPDGFDYSWFCNLYQTWAGRLRPTVRQVHVAGEKVFVDFAGCAAAGASIRKMRKVSRHRSVQIMSD